MMHHRARGAKHTYRTVECNVPFSFNGINLAPRLIPQIE
jgi:hypothetical protein